MAPSLSLRSGGQCTLRLGGRRWNAAAADNDAVLGVDQRTAQGINLLFFLPAAASALLCHRKNGYLDRPTLRTAIPPAAAFALLGAWIATAVDANVLRRPFGVYLLLAGVSLLWPQKKRKA